MNKSISYQNFGILTGLKSVLDNRNHFQNKMSKINIFLFSRCSVRSAIVYRLNDAIQAHYQLQFNGIREYRGKSAVFGTIVERQ